jgi:hypothetical protein
MATISSKARAELMTTSTSPREHDRVLGRIQASLAALGAARPGPGLRERSIETMATARRPPAGLKQRGPPRPTRHFSFPSKTKGPRKNNFSNRVVVGRSCSSISAEFRVV